MEYTISAVERNKFHKVVMVEVTFQGRKTVFRLKEGIPARDYKSAVLPTKIYDQAIKQVREIFREQRITVGYGRKIVEEAVLINAQALKHQASRRKPISIDEAIKAVIKARIKKEIPFESLDIWKKQIYRTGIRFMKDGWFVVTRSEKKGNVLKIIRQKVPDIDTVIRMHDHALEKYRGSVESEFARISNAEDAILEANRMLVGWNKLDYIERKEIEKRLVGVILFLEKCRNDQKQEVKRQIELVTKLRDQRDRINPGAMAARTIAALNALGRRFLQLDLVIPFIACRRELLILEKERSEARFARLANLAVSIYGKLFRINHSHFITRELKELRIDLAVKDIEEIKSHLARFITSPFLAIAVQADFVFSQAQIAIKKGDYEEAMVRVMEVHTILKNE
jgi:hypothetical protein